MLLFVHYGTKQYISLEQATEYGTNWFQTELRFYCPLCFLVGLSFYSSFKLLKREFKTYFYLNIQSYRAVNTVCLGYTNQSVNAV
jgi:hypothetical protein